MTYVRRLSGYPLFLSPLLRQEKEELDMGTFFRRFCCVQNQLPDIDSAQTFGNEAAIG